MGKSIHKSFEGLEWGKAEHDKQSEYGEYLAALVFDAGRSSDLLLHYLEWSQGAGRSVESKARTFMLRTALNRLRHSVMTGGNWQSEWHEVVAEYKRFCQSFPVGKHAEAASA